MGKFDGVLLASDFDDTLYGQDMRIAPANLTALDYFTREGGTFTKEYVRGAARFHRAFADAGTTSHTSIFIDFVSHCFEV